SIVTQYQEVNFMHKQNYFFTMLCINLFAFLNSSVNPIIVMSMSSRFRSGFITLGHKLLLCSGRAAEDAESAGRLSRSRRYARRYHESSASDDLDTYQRRRRSSAMSATLPTNSELG